MRHHDDYLSPDINPPADGDEPDDDGRVDEQVCAVCGRYLKDEPHDEDCTEREQTEEEYEAQVKRDWRRYAGTEPRYRRIRW